MEKYTGEEGKVVDTPATSDEISTASDELAVKPHDLKETESVPNPKLFESSENASKNPTRTEGMLVEDSVESEMEKLHSTLNADVNSTVSTNEDEKMNEDLQDILGSNENSASADDTLVQADENLTSAVDNLASTDDNLAPVDDNLVPADENLAPAHENSAPAPVDDNLVPSDENLAPAHENFTPAHANLGPADANSAPVSDHLVSADKNDSTIEMDTSVLETSSKVPEDKSHQDDPVETNSTNEQPIEAMDVSISDPTPEETSQDKNIIQSTESNKSVETEAQSKEIDLRCSEEYNEELFEKESTLPTEATEHADLPNLKQTADKNEGAAEEVSKEIESNPLAESSMDISTEGINNSKEKDQNAKESDSSSSIHNKSIEQLSSLSSLSTGDLLSTESSSRDDEQNKTSTENGSDITMDSIQCESQEGADAELCIIPDTHREISQAEKEAASSIPPLRDLTEASADQNEITPDQTSAEQTTDERIRIFKWDKDDLQLCQQCKLNRKANYYYTSNDVEKMYICDDTCLASFKETHQDKVVMGWDELNLRVKNFTAPETNKDQPTLSFVRKCASCKKNIENTETNLTWEIMDFCNEFCLTKYQKEIGSHCASCQGEVKSNSLGKYCVRFGNDIRQFCTSACLEKYKKGLKVCSYCQQDMSGGPQGFLAPVGDKGQFKDFCSQLCMEKYDIMTNDKPPEVPPGTICSVCKAEKQITIEYELDGKVHYFCREPCFVAFSFVNNISSGKCAMCRRHFPKSLLEKHTMYYDNSQYSFCSNSCENIYIIAHRKIVPCSWCKVKKYNFDMIRRYSTEGSVINMCSINCLNLYRVSVNAVSSRQSACNFCQKVSHPMYHLTMSDASVRNFCSYSCVMSFQGQFAKQPITINNVPGSFPVPTGAPRKNKKHPNATDNGPPHTEVPQLPIISSVQSLATNGNIVPQKTVSPNLPSMNTRTTRSKAASAVTPLINSNQQIVTSYADLPIQVQIKQHFIVRPAPLPEQRNVGTWCYTKKTSKSVTAKPEMVDRAVQTDVKEASKVIIPLPMPIYVPSPMHMFTNPTPMPVPIPIPIPIPVFIPTTSNCSAGILKQIKKLQVIPSDPYEAEILMMAEMVAEDKKEDTSDSESDVDNTGGPEDSYSPEPVDASNTFGDDMLQMALKMASELDEPAVDLEGALTANTITAPQGGDSHGQEENVNDSQPMHPMIADRSPSVRGRKRGMRQSRGGAKRGRRSSHHQVDMPMMQHQIQQPPPPPEPVEKPDANMCLKYTFGVNAWKQWVTTKNAELEKSRRPLIFKTEILQLTSDELNYSLCLFVKEVRKPNGAEYAPDTIYYLCLGIQQYLFENGRIDNIFCDPYYEKFTDCLDEVAKKFSVLYNDSHYIVTRVEEEHLWESKQLGAHSPHVLLSTLMFFNTKHFNLTTVDEHMQLSFSHIMKHWKRNPNQPGAAKVPGSRNVLLRFYPPQCAIQNNARKKKVYEQQENEENPLRCPVKLYEFYLSKCPESVKTRNDVFYLQPERSCIPDSPVWYSTMPLPKEALEKMLHRVKMVKEINVALLTS